MVIRMNVVGPPLPLWALIFLCKAPKCYLNSILELIVVLMCERDLILIAHVRTPIELAVVVLNDIQITRLMHHFGQFFVPLRLVRASSFFLGTIRIHYLFRIGKIIIIRIIDQITSSGVSKCLTSYSR